MNWHRVKTNASVGNVGPGFDAFGLCLDGPSDTYSLKLIDKDHSEIFEITGVDANRVPVNPQENCAIIAAEKFLSLHGIKQKVSLKIEREIPLAGGLGSSAAASVGGAFAAAVAAGMENHKDAVLLAALAGESFVAGEHLDNIAPCLLGGLTIVLSNAPPLVHQFELKEDFWSFVITKPGIELKTSDSRSVLPKQSNVKDWVKYMAHSSASLQHLVSGNAALLKESFKDHFAEQHRSQFIPNFQDIRDTANENNAVGHCISGAGPTSLAIFAKFGDAQTFEATIRNKYPENFTRICKVSNRGARVL